MSAKLQNHYAHQNYGLVISVRVVEFGSPIPIQRVKTFEKTLSDDCISCSLVNGLNRL